MHALLLSSVLAMQMATPAQHQHAAMALYEIFIAANLTGEFNGAWKDVTAVATKQKFDVALGSGVAVSSDGYVITADHVAGYTDIVRDVCIYMAQQWQSFDIEHMELHVSLSDLAGNTWPAIWDVRPSEGEADVCDGRYGMQVRFGAVRFIASAEPVADVALLKIDVPDSKSITHVPFGDTSQLIPFGSSLFTFGFTEPGTHVRRDGYLVRRCETWPAHIAVSGTGEVAKERRRLMRFTAELQEGMSGGPVMHGGHLAGIATNRGFLGTIALGVPSEYIRRWYEYVIGGREGESPQVVCELPTDLEPEP